MSIQLEKLKAKIIKKYDVRYFDGSTYAVSEEFEKDLDTLITQIIQNTGEELLRLVELKRNKIPDKFDQPFELAESVGSKMTLDTIKQHIIKLTGVE